MLNCPQCKKSVEPKDRFCPYCGTSLSNLQTTVQPVPPQNPQPLCLTEAEKTKEPFNARPRYLCWGILQLLALLFMCFDFVLIFDESVSGYELIRYSDQIYSFLGGMMLLLIFFILMGILTSCMGIFSGHPDPFLMKLMLAIEAFGSLLSVLIPYIYLQSLAALSIFGSYSLFRFAYGYYITILLAIFEIILFFAVFLPVLKD